MVLPSSEYRRLIEALGDSARTVLPIHFLLSGQATVFTDDAEALGTVAIRAEMAHPMVFAHAQDAAALGGLLADAGQTRMLWTTAEAAEAVQPIAEEAYGVKLSASPVEQKRVYSPPELPETPGYRVHRLTGDDAGALEAMHGELQWVKSGWGSWQRLLAEGVVIVASSGDEIASIATTYGRSVEHDDIAVATHPGHQRKGLCTACAAVMAGELLAAGRKPVWTVETWNAASRRVSEKLGFVTVFDAVGFREAQDE